MLYGRGNGSKSASNRNGGTGRRRPGPAATADVPPLPPQGGGLREALEGGPPECHET